ncbi:hypothetical protein [Haliea sp. E17]|uniref:hypothetical protein n=1 Tax=Haliea sp. E17 TaxID=3401576 RepID=UPI003AAF58C8
MSREALFDIVLPAQDLAQYSHFQPDAEHARAWAAQLPVTNIRAVSAQLLEALGDLNHCSLPPEIRFEILETLSDYLRVTLTNLTRRFLHQPLVMPAEPQRLAERAEALLAELQAAYTIVAIETQRSHERIHAVNPAKLLCESLQQALEFAGRRILLAFQLHRPAPLNSWLDLHRLYALAEWQGLEHHALKGAAQAGKTVASTYLQALMLGCSKPNQLLQTDLEAVFFALGEWHGKLHIGPVGKLEGLFCVDLASDQPAVYSSLYGDSGVATRRIINCEELVGHLQALRDPDNGYDGRGIRLGCGLTLPDAMLAHLMEALGSMSMRTYKRIATNTPVLVSLGISGAHYHAAGEHNFAQLLHGRDHRSDSLDAANPNPFLQPLHGGDIWSGSNSGAHDSHRGQQAGSAADFSHNIELDIFTRQVIEELEVAPMERAVPLYRVQQRNASPGGYCLEWDQNLPVDARNGEILCIQENPRAHWSIAMIRWVSRLENAHTLVGVELLSPRATACGIQPRQNIGNNRSPQRGLLLPEINLIGQPATLITPRAGFREGMKVSLLRYGEARHIQLERQRASTGSFTQFEFRDIHRLDELLNEKKLGPLDSLYDSVWSNI